MANFIYDKARKRATEGGLGWLTGNIKCVLVDAADYTASQANDEFLSDVPGAARVATSANLANKTNTAGVCDADDASFTAVSGDQSEAVVIYRDTGVAGTSELIAYLDTVTGLPITPSGTDIVLVWDNGANKIFKL